MRFKDPFLRRPMSDIPNVAGFKLWAFTKQTGVAVEAVVVKDDTGCHRLDAGSTALFSNWRPRNEVQS